MGPLSGSDEEKASFDFRAPRDLQNSSSSADEQTDLMLSSSLKKPYWPQSYERSMGFYSRSPPVVGRSSFSTFAGQCLVPSSVLPTYEDDDKLNVAKEPLLSDGYQKVKDSEDSIERSHVHFSQTVAHNGAEHTGHDLKLAQSSFFQAILNGMNILAGVGILSMPYAVSEGGWIGLSFLLIFAAVCCYTGVLLRRCLDLDRQILGYPDVGQAAFGKSGRIFISGLLYFELFAVAVEFLILEGDNLTQLFPWEGLNFGFLRLTSEQSFLILSAAVMLPTVWLRDLSLISYISAGGVVACVTVLVAVAWVGIFDVGFTHPGHVLNVQGFPIAVGLYAFCYCGHAVFPNIYCSMRDRKKFSHVLIVCFVLCTLIYGGMAVLGFLMFGDDIKSQVTLNLPKRGIASNIGIFATLVNPFAKYALTVTPLAAALEELLPDRWKTQNFAMWGIIIRTLLVASTVVVALTVPFFAYLMALVGSFLSTTVAITIPCICYLKLFSGRVSRWETRLMFLLIAIGLTACIAGTYSSILEIVRSLSNL